jgi:heme exporter protein B
MSQWKEVKALLGKEWLLEWRQRYAINGLLLYAASSIFVCYLSFQLNKGALHPLTWNALFWIILLFTALNAIGKAFQQEQDGRYYFYYTLASPQSIIAAKIIYNSLLLLGMGGLSFLFYSLVMGNPVADLPLFLANLALGGIGFSSSLTMIAAIASKAKNAGTLMAVLGFPVVLPMVLLLIKVSKNAIDGLDRSSSFDELITLAAINLTVWAASYLLFPYLWRS